MNKNILSFSILLIAASIAYYFFIFLPKQQSSQLALVQQQEAAKAQEAKANEDKQVTNKNELNTCIEQTKINYTETWTENCKSYAQTLQNKINNCESFGWSEDYCTNLYGKPDSSPSCTLPNSTADALDKAAQAGQDSCIKMYPQS